MIKQLLLVLFLTSNVFNKLFSNNNIILTSIPKCGTHLILKTLNLITGCSNVFWPDGLCLLLKSDLQKFKNGGIYTAHAICNENNLKIVDNQSFKTFFILRDPRDQIISMVFYIYQQPHWPDYKRFSIDKLIFELINNGSQIWARVFTCKPLWQDLKGIKEFYEHYLPWINHKNVYVTTFEKLVGQQGGGNGQIQKEEIIKIAQHLGKDLSYNESEAIVAKLFGGTTTFRMGKIGEWKKYFTQEHKIAFKKIAGDLLIELGYEKDLNW